MLIKRKVKRQVRNQKYLPHDQDKGTVMNFFSIAMSEWMIPNCDLRIKT